MSVFEAIWTFLMKRSQRGIMTVQEKYELGHVFALASDCKHYLEIGTAEGNSLYAMSHHATTSVSVDIREPHTRAALDEVLKLIPNEVILIDGNSHDPKIVTDAKAALPYYDCVMIDAGHTYEDVLQDAENYAPLAKQYVFFHDVQLPDVKRAVDEYVSKNNLKNRYHQFINSDNFGFGVLRC